MKLKQIKKEVGTTDFIVMLFFYPLIKFVDFIDFITCKIIGHKFMKNMKGKKTNCCERCFKIISLQKEK